MIFFYILITFVVVNAAEDYEAEIRKDTYRTNLVMEIAWEKYVVTRRDTTRLSGLEHIIEEMVNDDISYKSFDKINFLIAVPDQPDIIVNIPGHEWLEPMQKGSYYQYIMENEIRNELLIVIPPDTGSIDYRSLDLTTLAEQRRRCVVPALDNIFKHILGSMYDQFMMQLKLEIRDTLNFGGKNLAALVEERRASGTSLENVIRRVLGVDIPAEQNRPVHDVSLIVMCRYMGIYMSAQFPTSYIKRLLLDPDTNTCTLDDGTTQKKFKKVNGVWWQISLDDGTAQLLEEQLT